MGQTTAGSTLRKILEGHGEGHVIQLLRNFIETENRGARIDAFALYAISDIMVAYPAWADAGLRWYEIFDAVDIAAAQRQAKLNRDVVPQRYGTLLHRELSAAFAEKPDVAPPRKTARQQREELAAKKAGIVGRRIKLGHELAGLRDKTPNNVRFGAIVRQRFDLHDVNEVSEMMRVARVYSGRSEITAQSGGVRWSYWLCRLRRSRCGWSSRSESWRASASMAPKSFAPAGCGAD